MVNHTLDSFMESDLKVSAEIALEVNMCLLARAGTELAQIERVYSIPIALAQVRRWLAANLPRATLVESRSTAEAARLAHDDARGAAVASEMAAKLTICVVLRRKIEDLAAQHDPLPGARAPAGRADRARQDVGPARDARRAGHPLPHAGRLRRARAQHDQDREPPLAPARLGVRLLRRHRRARARRRRRRRARRGRARRGVGEGARLVPAADARS